MRIAILVNNSAVHDGRVRKTALALSSACHDVTVICRPHEMDDDSWQDGNVTFMPVSYKTPLAYLGLASDNNKRNTNSGIEALSDMPQSLSFLKKLLGRHLRDAWIHEECRHTMAPLLKKIAPHIIHANDLETLPAAIAGAQVTGASVVFDAHEIAIDEYPDLPFGSRSWRIWQERRLIRKIDGFVTMSVPAAEFFKNRYGIATDAVIYNSPSGPKGISCRSVREVCGIDTQTPLVIFMGYLRRDRGMMEILRAVKALPEIHFARIGPSWKSLDEDILQMVEQLGITERVHDVRPVNPMETAAFIKDANAALIVNRNSSQNVDLALPNKFFDAFLANVPLVVGRQKAVRDMVEQYNAGVVVDETNPEAIAAGLKHVLAYQETYRQSEAEQEMIIREYSWAAQADKISALYARLEQNRAP